MTVRSQSGGAVSEDNTLLLGLAAILTAIGGLIAARAKQKSNDRDAARIAYESLVRPLVDRVDRLERRVELLERENANLRTGVTILTEQIVEAGEEPRWRYTNGE